MFAQNLSFCYQRLIIDDKFNVQCQNSLSQTVTQSKLCPTLLKDLLYLFFQIGFYGKMSDMFL